MKTNQQKMAKKILLLTTLLVSLSANSAKYEKNNELREEDNGLNIFPYTNIFLLNRENAIQQAKERYQMVLRLIKQGKREQAKQSLAVFIEDPQQSAYYNLQALLDILDNNQEQAKESYHKALKLNAKPPRPLRDWLN